MWCSLWCHKVRVYARACQNSLPFLMLTHMEKVTDRTLTLVLPERIYTAMRERAIRDQRSMAAIARFAMDAYLSAETKSPGANRGTSTD